MSFWLIYLVCFISVFVSERDRLRLNGPIMGSGGEGCIRTCRLISLTIEYAVDVGVAKLARLVIPTGTGLVIGRR